MAEANSGLTDCGPFLKILGPLLGAQYAFARGVISADFPQDPAVEEAFVYRGQPLEWSSRSTTGVAVETSMSESTTTAGDHVEVGPPQHMAGTYFGKLLRPKYAYIWGRPGEDWHPSGRVDRVGLNFRVELVSDEVARGEGWAIVDHQDFFLHELHTDDTTFRMLEIHFEEA
ncbi:hypothetical protein [Aeromicrobium alkaliterrae]|uniref:Uncharacterized protein n=1 Tax=Aeromicrobium alkaliterrae TaxID=302168 RepID=A0ABN2KDL8_9ACTN